MKASQPSASPHVGNIDADDPPNGMDPRSRRSGLRRIFWARVPVWILVVSLLSVVGTLTALLVVEARSAVHLDPAVGAAQRIDVHMTLCNADVDRLEINPRTAELHLEDVLRSEDARMSNVVVHREDCPKTPSPSVPPDGIIP